MAEVPVAPGVLSDTILCSNWSAAVTSGGLIICGSFRKVLSSRECLTDQTVELVEHSELDSKTRSAVRCREETPSIWEYGRLVDEY